VSIVRFFAKHLLFLALTMLVVSFLVFALNEYSPGDVARKELGQFATQEQVDLLTERLGLNRPLLTRYVESLGRMVRGDLGQSLRFKVPVRDILLDRLKNKFGVAVDTVPHRISLRETFGGTAKGHGRHVKQSGGHGQYAICDIEVDPLESGQGFEFVDKVVGGAVPRQFIPSVEKGVRSQMEAGVLAGYPMVDIKVTLFDGKAHSVDSSDMAFQKAGRAALRDAVSKCQALLLEPVDEVSVLVADDYVGAVMSDLSSRRGRVLGTEPIGNGRTLVKAEVPATELVRYAVELRAMTSGAGTFSRTFARYDPMPSHLADAMRKEHANAH